MFEEIIEFDRDKIEANNYDIDKINAYLDELHDVKEIRKKAEGHYVGTLGKWSIRRGHHKNNRGRRTKERSEVL